MKKFIAGILAGMLIMMAGAVGADTISRIGKTVDTEYVVTVDGKQLQNKAISIEGTSYLPVREIGNTVGYTVDFSVQEGITLTSPETPSTASEENPKSSPVSENISTPKVDIDKEIDRVKNEIAVTNSQIVVAYSDIHGASEEEKAQIEKKIVGLKEKLEELKIELADLQAQKP